MFGCSAKINFDSQECVNVQIYDNNLSLYFVFLYTSECTDLFYIRKKTNASSSLILKCVAHEKHHKNVHYIFDVNSKHQKGTELNYNVIYFKI